jgi:8-oxo-dGTP diphosphatase
MVNPEGESGSENRKVKEFTVCVLLKGDDILLRLGTRGVSIGKWCAPGGKIEAGETKEDCAIRELREETGYSISKAGLVYHGNVDSNFPDDEAVYRVHVFSFKGDAGKQSTQREKAELSWFNKSMLPKDKMWKDYELWIDRVYRNEGFSIEVYYRSKDGDTIERSEIKDANKRKSAN